MCVLERVSGNWGTYIDRSQNKASKFQGNEIPSDPRTSGERLEDTRKIAK